MYTRMHVLTYVHILRHIWLDREYGVAKGLCLSPGPSTEGALTSHLLCE